MRQGRLNLNRTLCLWEEGEQVEIANIVVETDNTSTKIRRPENC